MKVKRVGALALAPAVVSALLAIGVMTVFSACGVKDDGTWMRCHDAQLATAGIAAAVAVVCAAAAFLRCGRVRAALYALGALASAVAFFVPGTIAPMCMLQTMRCYEVMQPFTRIMAVVTFVLCAWCALVSWRGSAGADAGRK